MTEEAREKLRTIYDEVTERARSVIEVFEHQFGSELVDNSLLTFDDFLEKLSRRTLGSLGIKRLSDSNEFGSYTIDPEDYEANGRGKYFTEYIPDLGIIDYLRLTLKDFLKRWVRANSPNSDYDAFSITIKFPEVTVTNEYDKSVVIQDLFVRVPVTLSGKTYEKFRMTRTTYPVDQWLSGYSHSHLPGINLDFTAPCTGTGPVNNTIRTLKARYDIQVWGLYSFEISKYVTVESIAGTPFRRLENIGSNNANVIDLSRLEYKGQVRSYDMAYTATQMKEFIRGFLKSGKVKFAFRNGNFTIGEDLLDIWIKMSNAFIEWHNDKLRSGKNNLFKATLIRSGVIGKYVVANGRAYNANVSSRFEQLQNDEGMSLFTFKGETQRLHFLGTTSNTNETILIDIQLVYYALTKALEIINHRYGREKAREEGVSVDSRTLYL